jgi:phosphatidylglycerophosphate synthase
MASSIDSGAARSLGEVEGTQAASEQTREGFWAGYWKSLKPLAVEEPIDVWVHRPLAYLLARALLKAPISPNLVTLVSIAFGIATGVAMVLDFPGHLPIAGLCLFLSAVFDCADGQLARMRGTSSVFGRMLDGCADFVVALAAVGGSIWVIWSKYDQPTWLGLIVLALCVATSVTGSFHTGMYDHFKNVYLRLTSEHFTEGESYARALERYRNGQDQHSLGARLAWPIYLFYTKSQEEVVRGFDPFTPTRFELLPRYDAAHAEIYRAEAGSLMRTWRNWFGFGSLVFGIAASVALNVLEWYMLARLIGLNALFYGYLRPAQRRASQAAFARIGVNTAGGETP